MDYRFDIPMSDNRRIVLKHERSARHLFGFLQALCPWHEKIWCGEI